MDCAAFVFIENSFAVAVSEVLAFHGLNFDKAPKDFFSFYSTTCVANGQLLPEKQFGNLFEMHKVCKS